MRPEMTAFLTYNFVGAATAGTDLGSAASQGGASFVKHGSYSSGSSIVGATNGIYNGVGGQDSVYYVSGVSPSTPDYDVTISFNLVSLLAGAEVGCGIRVSTSANTGYFIAYDYTLAEWILFKRVAGSNTNLATFTFAYTSTGVHSLILSARGTSIYCYVDGVLVASASDSSIVSTGVPATWMQSAPLAASDSAGFHLLSMTASNAASMQFAANAPGIVLAPGISQVVSGTSVAWIDPGYAKFDITGTSVGISFDVSSFIAGSVSSANYPALYWSIDGGAWQGMQFPSSASTGSFWLGTALTYGTHTVEARYQINDESETYAGTPPTDRMLITGWSGDPSAAISAPTGNAVQRSGSVMIFGDSITRGAFAQTQEDGSTALSNLCRQTWPVLFSFGISSEYGISGKSGQGWTVNATDGSPPFPTTFANYYAGNARVWPAGLADLIVAHGTNDYAASSASVQAAVLAWLPVARAAVGVSCRISVIVPLNGTQRTAIVAAVAAYQSANPTDYLVRVVDPSQNWIGGAQFTNAPHPYNEGHALAAALIVAQYKNAWDMPFVARPVTQSITVFQYESVGVQWGPLLDANGEPISLVGKTINCHAWDTDGSILNPTFSEPGVVSGLASNVVTVTFQPSDLMTAQTLQYSLWDVTDKTVLATGAITVLPATMY